jgi:hypothetical protein
MNFVDTEVEAVFYNDSSNDGLPARLYQFITKQKIAHCSLRFIQGERRYMVIIHQRGGMYFVPENRYFWLMEKEKIDVGETTVPLGTAPISLTQLSCFIDRPDFEISPFLVNAFWWLLGRHISKTYQPMTCSLIVCIILRFCGFDVSLHVTPHQLYKEISDGINNNLRTS